MADFPKLLSASPATSRHPTELVLITAEQATISLSQLILPVFTGLNTDMELCIENIAIISKELNYHETVQTLIAAGLKTIKAKLDCPDENLCSRLSTAFTLYFGHVLPVLLSIYPKHQMLILCFRNQILAPTLGRLGVVLSTIFPAIVKTLAGTVVLHRLMQVLVCTRVGIRDDVDLQISRVLKLFRAKLADNNEQ